MLIFPKKQLCKKQLFALKLKLDDPNFPRFLLQISLNCTHFCNRADLGNFLSFILVHQFAWMNIFKTDNGSFTSRP